MQFKSINIDVRSQALKEFLGPELRKGLGIYLTPDPVVQLAVELLDLGPNATVLDPACGSGTFLIEAVKSMQRHNYNCVSVYGIDKSPRMLLLAELNLGHLAGVDFQRRVCDTLSPHDLLKSDQEWPKPGSVDVILTNPPFGVSISLSSRDRAYYTSIRNDRSAQCPSEVLFLEQCLRLLKPGGVLGIVLPRSVLTNRSLAYSRAAIGQLGYVLTAVSLPPETFSTTGTQAATWLLVMKRYEQGETPDEPCTPVVAQITNVGYDSTGRHRDGSQLPTLSNIIQNCMCGHNLSDSVYLLPPTPKGDSLSCLTMASGRESSEGTYRLGDLVTIAKTGRTPARAAYSDRGLFLVKVGNLTGSGINWEPRDRNFVEYKPGGRWLELQKGDILLTSSAHTVSYIAKKVDIVHSIPAEVGARASFVGEVMLLRANIDVVNPFALLCFLRMPTTVLAIQRMVSGQTAHLMPEDILSLPVPRWVVEGSVRFDELIELVEQECELSTQLVKIGFRQRVLLAHGY